MVGAMAKHEMQDYDDLVRRAKADAQALGELYELYYEPILRFCVYRLFDKQAAEDLTSTIFLEMARGIRRFEGQSEADFRRWLYAIAVNQTNAYVRKSSRRRKLFERAAALRAKGPNEDTGEAGQIDWPMLYAGIVRLKLEHQTIVTLRFFENLSYDEIARIINIPATTLRVTVHRILKELREHLQSDFDE
jgi:RNA polymerase sigma-70 factor (ECF subfamily)